MSPETFVVILAVLCAALFGWAFRVLPHERWQLLAAVPLRKDADGRWRALNLTYPGCSRRSPTPPARRCSSVSPRRWA